jgi:hypothetical protein
MSLTALATDTHRRQLAARRRFRSLAVSPFMTEAGNICGWRQWAARLALLLSFCRDPAGIAAPAGAGRYVTGCALKAGSGGAHGTIMAYALPQLRGHVCLEQHRTLARPPLLLLALPSSSPILISPVRAALWPHPATAPPLWRIAQACQPRAPPLLA